MSLPGKQSIGLDFDGVVHSYTSGWQGYDVIPDPPTLGVKEAIREMRKTHNVIIYSCRACEPEGRDAIEVYLAKYGIEVDGITDRKPVAEFIVDDRAVTFHGDWAGILRIFHAGFIPWNKGELNWDQIAEQGKEKEAERPEAVQVVSMELDRGVICTRQATPMGILEMVRQPQMDIHIRVTFPPTDEQDSVVDYEQAARIARKMLEAI